MRVSSLIFCFFSFSSLGAAQWSNTKCGQVSSSKRTVLERPPSLPETCQYTIEAHSRHTCRLLIQFQRFVLPQPTLRDGILECKDRFTIGDFILCGNNDQQHLYIPIEADKKARVSFNFQLPSRWSQTTWSLVVTQLECAHSSDVLRFSNMPGMGILQSIENATRNLFPTPNFGDLDILAPPGCHQYFTQPTGTIRSFNFNASARSLYMPNLKYLICIKAPEGVTAIDYTVKNFSMSIESVSSPGYDSDCHSMVMTPGRRTDYLMIPQSSLPNLPNFTPTYYCGQRSLDGFQVKASLPFLIYFQSDELSDSTETGFAINYRVK